MVHVQTLIFAGLLQALGLCVLLLLGLGFAAWRRRRRDRAAVAALIASVQSEAESRRETLGTALGATGRSAEDVESIVKQIERDQKLLIRDLLKAYSTRDAEAVAGIAQPVHDLVCGIVGGLAAEGTPAAESGAEPEEVAALREKNEVLETELRITRETMRNMLEEYARNTGAQATPTEEDDVPVEVVSGDEVGSLDDVADEIAALTEPEPPPAAAEPADPLDDLDQAVENLGDFEVDLGGEKRRRRTEEPASA